MPPPTLIPENKDLADLFLGFSFSTYGFSASPRLGSESGVPDSGDFARSRRCRRSPMSYPPPWVSHRIPCDPRLAWVSAIRVGSHAHVAPPPSAVGPAASGGLRSPGSILSRTLSNPYPPGTGTNSTSLAAVLSTCFPKISVISVHQW
jgi:hypothetical protein